MICKPVLNNQNFINREERLEVLFFQKVDNTKNKCSAKNWEQGYSNNNNAIRVVIFF